MLKLSTISSRQAVLPSDMLLRICRKHMSRFLISSRSSLSQRSTVLPRADAHWFWYTKEGRGGSKVQESWDKRRRRKRRGFSYQHHPAESQTECTLQREKKNIPLPKLQEMRNVKCFPRIGGGGCRESKYKHICCSSFVLWDSNNHCRFEENTFLVTLQHLRKYTMRSAQPSVKSTHTHTPWCGTLRREECWEELWEDFGCIVQISTKLRSAVYFVSDVSSFWNPTNCSLLDSVQY